MPRVTNSTKNTNNQGFEKIQERTNDEKVKRPKAVRNTPLRTSTTTSPENMDAKAYDELNFGSTSGRPPAPEFQTTVDGQSLREDCGGIPGMAPVSYSLTSDKSFSDVVERDGYNDTTLPGEMAFRKQARRIEMTEDDMRKIGQGGVVDAATKQPTFPRIEKSSNVSHAPQFPSQYTSNNLNRQIDQYHGV
jgi:hypothetical protein